MKMHLLVATVMRQLFSLMYCAPRSSAYQLTVHSSCHDTFAFSILEQTTFG